MSVICQSEHIGKNRGRLNQEMFIAKQTIRKRNKIRKLNYI